MTPEDTDTPSRRSILMRACVFATMFAVVVLATSSTIVNDNEYALVTRFGKPVRVVKDAGWYFHLPSPMEKVQLVDARLQHSTIRLSETLTGDKRNVILPMYFSWKVDDPLMFLNNVSTTDGANKKLDSLITSARNSALGVTSFHELINEEGNSKVLDGLEQRILASAQEDAKQHLGIELVSLGVTEIKLPKGNTEAVFRRMRAERKREASTYRAEGKAKADQIKTQADTKSRAMLADARREAEQIRGEAEAEAAAIYSQAHAKDIEFYRFMRSLQSLRAVVDKNTTLVLDTDTKPFHMLKLEDPKQAPHLQPDSQSQQRPHTASFPLRSTREPISQPKQ